ncbi:TatD family hydrolase [Archaeoglobus profundus]|uniref:TatD-related deoxyribonuclease n=1 Tax=Archaeoglobus profundus (strain DSM 5631 / JCM 9629 / NBRC 100127 / Av18) TaxID=572546 RepID=D2RGV7_ARCPA|nr:TatD family hydrolase [Archaeoglobus profundus]ADB57532.1 TatD-related deoxyribonuclease [Archaeoglobus profundus DSM 5631]
MIITDDHMHLYNHLKFKALEQFKSAGGTHVFLVNLLSKHYGLKPTKPEDYLEMFKKHISMVEKANKIVRAFAVIGVHPAEITLLGGRMKVQKAAEIMKSAFDLAGKLIEEGKAVALKSGRPHYKVSKEIWDLSNEVMKHAFEVAKDVGCAVQLHTESYTYEGIKEIAEMADKVGLKRYKVVKHFSPPKIKEFEEIGIFPSVICLNDYALEAAKQGSRFMLETDYIDDKDRPGAVLGPKTVPRKVKELLKHGFDEDFIYKICVENVEKVYGVEIE